MPQKLKEVKETRVVFTVKKMLQRCVGKVDEFRRAYVAGMSIIFGSEDDMALNPTIVVFSAITHGG